MSTPAASWCWRASSTASSATASNSSPEISPAWRCRSARRSRADRGQLPTVVTGNSSSMTIPSLRSEAQELVAACPQAGELDEVLGIEEQLVYATELVDGQALRAVDQVVQVLEGVLGAVADVMGAQHTTTASIHHQLLEAAQLGHGEAVQHGALGQGEWEALGVEVLDAWGHLDDDHVGDPLACLLLGEADPGDLIGGVEEVGVLGEVELGRFAHDVLGRGHPALARLEHLHRRPDEVADGVDVGDAGPHRLVDHDLFAGPDGHAEDLTGLRGVRRLPGADEDEVGVDLEQLTAREPDSDPLDPVAPQDRHGLGALADVDAALVDAVDDVPPEVLVHVVQARRAHQRRAADDGGVAAGGVEERPVFERGLASADDHAAPRLVVQLLDQGGEVEHAALVDAGHLGGPRLRAHAEHQVPRAEHPAPSPHGIGIDQPARRVEHVLDVELLLSLPVHEGVRVGAATEEEPDDLQDADS